MYAGRLRILNVPLGLEQPDEGTRGIILLICVGIIVCIPAAPRAGLAQTQLLPYGSRWPFDTATAISRYQHVA